MKKTKFFGAAVAMLFCVVNANAQATATANASATIVSPISISKTTDLSFGNLSVDATGGTVILPPVASPTRLSSGVGGVSFPSNTGTVTAAAFTVSGQANFTFTTNVVNSNIILSNGTDEMLVENFSVSSGAGTLSGSGIQNIFVGADLVVAASQASGVYTSSAPFTVMVNYN